MPAGGTVCRADSGGAPRWLLTGVASSCLLLAAGARGAEPLPRPQTQTAPTSPVRVFTNADLERYGRPGAVRSPGRTASAPPPAAAPEADSPVAAAVAIPPEDRIEPVATPDLRAREAELEALLQYLQAKERWLKNPLLPSPAPPAGEQLTDPATGSGRQYESTRIRAAQTETRLLRVRAMLQARGED